MALTEQQKEIALREAKEIPEFLWSENCGYESGVIEPQVIDFASRFLAALPKPEPMCAAAMLDQWFLAKSGIDPTTPLYTEAPITPPASEQKPVAYMASCGLGHWFSETKSDIPGVVFKPLYFAPQPDYKAQRDATQALSDVIAERHRQQTAEGWTPEHDDQHKNGELALAAAAYAFNSVRSHQLPPYWWPWAPEWWKPTTARRDLVKAAALILARVEQIDRVAIASVKGGA